MCGSTDDLGLHIQKNLFVTKCWPVRDQALQADHLLSSCCAHFVSRLKIFSSNCHCFRILTFLLCQGISHFNPSYTAVSVTVNGFGLATLMI